MINISNSSSWNKRCLWDLWDLECLYKKLVTYVAIGFRCRFRHPLPCQWDLLHVNHLYFCVNVHEPLIIKWLERPCFNYDQ